MGERVIADLIAFLENARGDGRKSVGLVADQKEGGLRILVLQDVKDLRCPLRVGAVVEGDHYLIRAGTIAAQPIRLWERVHRFLGDQAS